ncbi:pathogenicity determinant protein PdpA1 [Francisella philomiragia]|uniref:pathogenicity determinant protein PdpA1 n=1 Tax=Francisella philomiragia TaxID=28110 RepID=UPI001906752C|nr:pathogenicity determinant protein PdpA1 [Francisella philomiragia]MBK2268232.1 pathogenicity determinant protein PdpA1 [Francisella philomiragia]MBK2279773.1 pathogenicity determinant protein PdpA1 [Francisella philomiragia]MBK2287543.1 pathogenicity determinant protein PdpA1 [Francisella philomiragia]MBK2289522.1 pathogenicity determinant protein PdpA1 [Francisella philomiragia]MBK2291420.1 pathogenicity determinant protein PdpA1 [Francisella philomiragia]
MITISNITDLNINNIINQLASNLADDSITLPSAQLACEVNNYIITHKLENIDIINLQLKTTKALYKKSLISVLDYKKYQQYCKITQLKNNIDQFTLYFSSSNKDSQSLELAILELKNSYQSDLILELSYDYIKKIDNLLNIIDNAIQRSSSLKKTILREFNKLRNNLSKYIAYNSVLQKQELIINIKPINQNFETENINFISTNNKQYFKQNSLTLKNSHIKNLEVRENIYGVSGDLTFNLAYINNHKDFDFLLIPNQPILIDIQINDSFNFYKKDSKKEHHTRSSRFVVVGFNSNNVDINEDFEYSIYSYSKNISSGVKEFKIKFHDPLKAFWSKHKPSYIDINKSLDDIFKDNFFFNGLFSLDTNKSDSLKNRIPQVFISTVNRSFYDFFIDQLEQNKSYLKYFCDKKNGKVTYYVVDEVDSSLQNNISNSDENLKTKLSPYDISCFKKQSLIANKPNLYIKENDISPDITINNKRKEERKTSNASAKAFSSIYKDNFLAVQYLQNSNNENKEVTSSEFQILLTSKNTLPFIDSEISLSKLENDNSFILGTTNIKNLFICERKLSFTRSKYATKELYHNLDKLHYKTDSESDVYEKIAFTKILNRTHDNLVTYRIKSYSDIAPEYPSYKTFYNFYINGKITIGENVNNDSKKAYKFFKNYKPEESSFSEFQESGEKGTSIIQNSKTDIFYAVEIIKEILPDKSSEKPIIYIPMKVNINSANNQFMPLRNDDIILIEAQSLTNAEIVQLISNSAISTEKAQQQLLQRQLLGAKENCEMAYTQTSDGETFSLTQLNEACENSFLINNKKGIFLRYKSKGN